MDIVSWDNYPSWHKKDEYTTAVDGAMQHVSYKTSPKTGAALPALPFVAVFAAAGIVVCGRKARKN